MVLARNKRLLFIPWALSALMVTSCSGPSDADVSGLGGLERSLSPRVIESVDEAFGVFDVIAEATLAGTSIPQNQMLMTYVAGVTSNPRVDLYAPGSSWLFNSYATPIGGMSNKEGQSPSSETSQLGCPGYIYELNPQLVTPDFPVEFELDHNMLFNIAHSNMSPELWVGEARNGWDGVVHPTDVWAVTPEAFLAMHRESGSMRIFTLDVTAMITSFVAGTLSVESSVAESEEFLRQFVQGAGRQALQDDYDAYDIETVLTAADPGLTLAGTEGLGADWWLSAADRLDELILTSELSDEGTALFLDVVWDYENAREFASERGLQFDFSSIVVRVPDGEVFSIIAMYEGQDSPEPLTVVTLGRNGVTPAIDSQGNEIVCDVITDFLGVYSFDSPSTERERFFVE
jgi:hypothetical protein